MSETGHGEVSETVENGQELQHVVVQAYQAALNDAYPDPADEPGFPAELSIDMMVGFEEVGDGE